MDFSGQYLTFTEYKVFGGTLDQTPFNLLEFKARQEVNKATFGRLIDLTSQNEDVKLCMFDMINTLKMSEVSKAGNVSSETIDGYGVSYNNMTTKEKNDILYNIISGYLANCKLEDGTSYLYRGVCE